MVKDGSIVGDMLSLLPKGVVYRRGGNHDQNPDGFKLVQQLLHDKLRMIKDHDQKVDRCFFQTHPDFST